MIKKIVKLSIGQIIMWGAACLADAIYQRQMDNEFSGIIFLFLIPVCILGIYSMMWMSINLYNKDKKLYKWIFQCGVYLIIWWLEIIISMRLFIWAYKMNKWIIPQRGWIEGITYLMWSILAAIIPVTAIIMHILNNVIKSFKQHGIIHSVINILFGMCIASAVYFGMTVYAAWEYYEVAILVAGACFFFNWCYYKVQ